jgi:uncharacterized protein
MILARLREARAARRGRWEALCRRCGLCCYEKDIRGGRVVTNHNRPCVHLNTRTHACSIYENRFRICGQCRRMTLFHALFVRWLPESCGYVQRFRPGARQGRRAAPMPASDAREG